MGDWFVSPLHPLTDSLEKLAYIQGSCPVAEELCRTTVNLPTHPKVTYREASKLLTTVTTVGEPI
jgi:dTDP-4-amino-4,6-dideoxygalactose transaminase